MDRFMGSISSTWDGARLVEVALYGAALCGGVPASLAELARPSCLQLQAYALGSPLLVLL